MSNSYRLGSYIKRNGHKKMPILYIVLLLTIVGAILYFIWKYFLNRDSHNNPTAENPNLISSADDEFSKLN